VRTPPTPAGLDRASPILGDRLQRTLQGLLLASGLLTSLASVGCLKIPEEGATPPEEEGSLDRDELRRVELWPGKPAGELYAVGETRAYVFRRGDALIGHSWGRYEGPTSDAPPLHRFTTRVELNLPGREPLRSAGEIVVDGEGRLIRGSEQSGPTLLRFSREGELLRITDGHQEEELKAGKDAAYMAFAAIFHEELMLGLRPLRSGEFGWRMLSLSGSLPIDWSAAAEVIGDPATRYPAARLSTSLGETITVEKGRITAIDVVDEGLTIRPTEEAWPEWDLRPPRILSYTPAQGATFSRREVELPGRPGEPKLSGELLLPAAAKRGPRPAALFLSGTGRQDRYGFAGPPPVDLGAHAITDALAEAGFVVLRFDERDQGQSGEGPRSWDLQLEDARRALRTLTVQDEVDPDRIVLIGHGEGGWRALELDGEGRGVIAVALLGTPGRAYRTLLDEQAEADIETIPPELRERAREEHGRLMNALLGGANLPPELVDEAEWARGLLRIDPSKLLAKGSSPLWVAQGSRDFEVDPERDPATLQALARKHRRSVSVRRYPGLDHLFKLETGTSSPARYLDPDGPREVDPAFLGDLTQWLAGVASRGPSKGGQAKSKSKSKSKTRSKAKSQPSGQPSGQAKSETRGRTTKPRK